MVHYFACEGCGATFAVSEAGTIREFFGNDYWEDAYCCPNCRDTNLSPAHPCDVCGDVYNSDSLNILGEVYVCNQCHKDITKVMLKARADIRKMKKCDDFVAENLISFYFE